MSAPELPPVPPSSSSVGPRGARFRAWVGRHPILLVALLSPGIVEYLSGSSKLGGIVVAPPLFALLLCFNLGLYVPGVLLIREARIRWRGGWTTVILLGCAYAIVEEGLALSTLFNPQASVVGALGFYGHFLGVSWVWLVGVVAVHVVFSIGLPILLLDLALPTSRGVPFLARRGIAAALGVLALTTSSLLLVTWGLFHFFAGVPIVLGSLIAIAALVWAARTVPRDLVRPWHAGPTRPPWVFAILGTAFWPGLLLIDALFGVAGMPPAVTVLALLGALLAFLLVVSAGIGRVANERCLLALTMGLVAPIMFAGAVVGLGVPVVLVGDVLAIWFFLFLWRRYDAPRRDVPAHVQATPA
ncbi:MAG: hypothetical protein L3K18_01230 [Thermoplasmata archaeon]|nr:hypothetical protein [Thermoplasmata archaeon]MCI4355751.1 hypothetical protein [Thermoplasmata archaeon]